MLRTATANLLIAVLLGCPFSCLAESVHAHPVKADGCEENAGDACCRHSANGGQLPPTDVPCDDHDCPHPDCICAGAVFSAVDDAADYQADCVVWMPFQPDAQDTGFSGAAVEVQRLSCELPIPDAQRRCALIGTFLL